MAVGPQGLLACRGAGRFDHAGLDDEDVRAGPGVCPPLRQPRPRRAARPSRPGAGCLPAAGLADPRDREQYGTERRRQALSRLGPYDVTELDRLLWDERKLFEWNAYIWPIESLPLVQARMRKRRRSRHYKHEQWSAEFLGAQRALQALRAARARAQWADAIARAPARVRSAARRAAPLVGYPRGDAHARDPPRLRSSSRSPGGRGSSGSGTSPSAGIRRGTR